MLLVGPTETLTVSAVGAQGEPQRVVPIAVIDIGLDLRAAGLAVGDDAMESIGEHVDAVGAKDDDGGKPGPVRKSIAILDDDVLINSRPDLGARVKDEAVEENDLTDRNTRRRVGWQAWRRRGTRSHCKGKTSEAPPQTHKHVG